MPAAPVPHPPHLVHGFLLARVDDHVRVLLVERTPARGGGWFGLGGPVRMGEPLADAAARYLGLEIGWLHAAPVRRVDGYLHRVPVPPAERAQYPCGTEYLAEHAFWCLIPDVVPPQLDHDRYARAQWLRVQPALGRLTFAMHARALRLALAAAHSSVPLARGAEDRA